MVLLMVIAALVATSAQPLRLSQPLGITLARDGSLLVADGPSGRVLRVDPRTGRLRVAVSGLEFAADVAVARNTIYVTGERRVYRVVRGRGVVVARSGVPFGITISRGTVVFAELDPPRVRRIVGATVETVLDGLHRPHDVVAAPDGELLIADTDANRIVRGDKVYDVHNPFQIALGPDGSIYSADPLDAVVRRVWPNGRVTVVTRRATNPGGVAVDARGNLYVADHDSGSVFKVAPGGRATVLVR